MANPEHLKILKQGVKTWNKWRKENRHIEPDLCEADLKNVDLSGVDFTEANLDTADLRGADLSSSSLREADLFDANLTGANLMHTDLVRADLGTARLTRADLTAAELYCVDLVCANLEEAILQDTNLMGCQLVGANLSRAILTGAQLYATSRDDWVIKDIKCKYVYWDMYGKQRCPKDRDLEPGEFERLYASLPTIEYIFENGMSPIDPLIMDRVVQAIREKKPEFDIKLDSINARGLAPSIKFTVQLEKHKETALKEVKKEYEAKIKLLKAERDRYYQLVSRAIDTPKEVKLITAGPGAIVATDGSTINIQAHIHNALELQNAIAKEPEDSKSFAKVAKRKALDIIGGVIEDIAKGQVKEAGKQIIELAKDLGPIIAKTAAYAFFKTMLQ